MLTTFFLTIWHWCHYKKMIADCSEYGAVKTKIHEYFCQHLSVNLCGAIIQPQSFIAFTINISLCTCKDLQHSVNCTGVTLKLTVIYTVLIKCMFLQLLYSDTKITMEKTKLHKWFIPLIIFAFVCFLSGSNVLNQYCTFIKWNLFLVLLNLFVIVFGFYRTTALKSSENICLKPTTEALNAFLST